MINSENIDETYNPLSHSQDFLLPQLVTFSARVK